MNVSLLLATIVTNRYNAAAQGRAGTMRAKHDNGSGRVPCSRMLDLVLSWTRALKEIE